MANAEIKQSMILFALEVRLDKDCLFFTNDNSQLLRCLDAGINLFSLYIVVSCCITKYLSKEVWMRNFRVTKFKKCLENRCQERIDAKRE